jgi:hypothetical protein
MRRLLWTVVGLAVAGAFWLMQDVLHGADRTRIFATFVSHNEESASNPECAPVLTDRARFAANRAASLEFARVVLEGRGTWNMQAEWEYLLRLAEWETAEERDRTAGLNLVQFLNIVDRQRIQVDAHSHEKRGYNYADVAWLLEQLGVPPDGVVGGFVWWPTEEQSWTRLRAPLKGLKYPAYTWSATALWGGGSAGHRNDSNASGIWRPKSADEFEVDDPNQALVNVGNYPGADYALSGDPIAYLLAKLRSGQLEAGKMYTATIMVKQCNLDIDPTMAASAAALLERFAPDVANGDLVWTPLDEMVRVWRDDYGSAPLVAHP